MLLLSLAVFLSITLSSPAPDLGEEQLTFSGETWRAESRELKKKAWYRNHRMLGVALAAATIALVTVFV